MIFLKIKAFAIAFELPLLGGAMYTLFLVMGIFLQIFSYVMSFCFDRMLISEEGNKSFSFMMNKVIVRRSMLFLGAFFVSLVTLLESDYILFTAQCLLLFVFYPKNE